MRWTPACCTGVRVKRSWWYSCSWCPFSGPEPIAQTKDVMADASTPRARMNEDLKNLYLARALYDAVEDCNIQQVNLLLCNNKASPNIVIPEEGMTPFHLAAGHENLGFGKVVTSLFLHNGGDPNVRCEGDRTVLHIGVAWNRATVVKILLNSTCIVPDPYLKDEDGLNAFNYAIKFKAWEALATLQTYAKPPVTTTVRCNKVKFLEVSKHSEEDNSIENKEQKKNTADIESEFDKTDNLHRSSGCFNSYESVNNISVSQINNVPHEFSSSADSLNDILNKNIAPDYSYSDKMSELSAHTSTEDLNLNSIAQSNDDFEDLENISFPSEHLLDTEFMKPSETKLTTENCSSQSENNECSMNSELMTDVSGLSSYVGSDDYYTCPDTNSKPNLNRKIDKTDIQLEEKVTGSYSNLKSDSITELPTEAKKVEVPEHHSDLSEDSSVTEMSDDYDTDYLRQRLRKYGCPPGPVVQTTKQLYVRKLNRMKKDEAQFKTDDKNIKIVTSGLYSCQLTKVLFDNSFDLWKETLNSWSYLERDIICPKSGPSFTYLLIDPRVTKNLPARAEKMKNSLKVWQTFVNSIFYIGKGTKSRPNDHMMEAFNSWVGTNTRAMSQKTEYIINLWRENIGVVCVQAFHHLTVKEAHIREAAMIDAIGLDRLTNERRGTYYDKTLRWRYSERCKLGCYLLNRAMHVFLADGERQLQPADLT